MESECEICHYIGSEQCIQTAVGVVTRLWPGHSRVQFLAGADLSL